VSNATSWQQVIVMELGKRHETSDTTNFLPAPTHTLVTLRTRYRETGVMDFGLCRRPVIIDQTREGSTATIRPT